MDKHEAYSIVLAEMNRLLINMNNNKFQKDIFLKNIVTEFQNISCPIEHRSEREQFDLHCEKLKQRQGDCY